MLRLKDKIEASVTYADRAGSATRADVASAVAWGSISGNPLHFLPHRTLIRTFLCQAEIYLAELHLLLLEILENQPD